MLSPVEFWIAVGVCAGGGFLLFAMRQRIKQDKGFLAVTFHSVAACFSGANSAARQEAADAGAEAGSISRSSFFASAARKFGAEVAEGPLAVFRIISVFLLVSVFWALFDQHMSSWIRQAQQMNLVVFGWEMLPSQIQSLNPLLVMLLLPVANMFVYPGMAKIGFNPTPLRRMTVGMFVAASAFVTVALIQRSIMSSPPESVSVVWQVIPYIIMTMAEVMVSVTGLEFAYTQAPKAMKSTIMGFWLLSVSLGNILVVLLTGFEDMSLENFFWVFAGLMAGAAVLFAGFSLFYRYKDYQQ